jgi:hypothetical protein
MRRGLIVLAVIVGLYIVGLRAQAPSQPGAYIGWTGTGTCPAPAPSQNGLCLAPTGVVSLTVNGSPYAPLLQGPPGTFPSTYTATFACRGTKNSAESVYAGYTNVCTVTGVAP